MQFMLSVLTSLQEVNPSLADEESVKQTVAVGCSLARSALGTSCHPICCLLGPTHPRRR